MRALLLSSVFTVLVAVPAMVRAASGPPGTLDRAAALKLVQAYLQAHQLRGHPGLNDHDLGGVDLGRQTVYFEYVPGRRVLIARALVYRFRQPPRPGVIAGFQAEERAGTDAGGGTVEYLPEGRGLYLARTYGAAVPEAEFVKDTDRLAQASQRWGQEVLERVAARAFHHQDTPQH